MHKDQVKIKKYKEIRERLLVYSLTFLHVIIDCMIKLN